MFDQETMNQLASALAAKVLSSLPKPGVQQRYFTVEQAASYVGKSKKSFEYIMSKNLFPIIREDRHVWIDREELDLFMANHRT